MVSLNDLYDAFRASMKGSAWKAEPQRFERDFLSELVKLKKELDAHSYRTGPSVDFILRERGKVRYIHGGRMRDRTVRHYLCDTILTPAMSKYIIYENCASQKGKGVTLQREIFERELHNSYLKYGGGYVGFMDFSKFYDNIRHDKVKELFYPHITETWLMDEVLRSFEVDISGDDKFDAVEYERARPLKSGIKYMPKSVNIGDQVAQNIGICYPKRIDNLMKIVRRADYGRYMDDIYILRETKEEIETDFTAIKQEADRLGLFVNEIKTRILPTAKPFRYLQRTYRLTDTGKVIKHITPEGRRRERRKLRKYRHLLDKGRIDINDIENSYKSWMGNFSGVMSDGEINSMQALYEQLFGRRLKEWQLIR